MQSKSEIRIDQALHGYGRGHRQLASSIELDDQSRAEMLVLSDLLVSAAVDRGQSYLTAYPLKSASRYVLARTWAAGKEFRPGSVWTHSLLLDYQALVLLPDLMRLNPLFRQPQQQDFKDYALPVSLETRGWEKGDIFVSVQQATTALVKLYGPRHVDDVIVPSGPDQDNQILALALWRQMWPALRRQFAFTTAKGASLPGFGFACTLRFSADQNIDVTLDPLDEVQGFHALLDDLATGGPTPLRTFLSRYVIESSQPRKTAVELAGFFGRLAELDPVERLDLAQPLIAKNRLPRLAKDLVADAVNNASDFEQILYLARTLRDIPVGMKPDALVKRVAPDLDQLGILLNTSQSDVEGSFGSILFEGLVLQLPLAHVSQAATQSNRIKMAQLRPETVSQKEWWPSEDSERAQLVGILADYDEIDWGCVLNVLSPTIGPRTVSALLVALADGAEQIGMELFAWAGPQIIDVVAEWFVTRPTALKRLAVSLGTVGPEQLKALTQAQIRQPPPFRSQEGWAEIFTAAGDAAAFCDASLTIGYLLSLSAQEALSLQLGRLVFEPVYLARDTYRLGRSEMRYLDLSLRRTGISLNGTGAIVQSALEKWPVQDSDCGALAFCKSQTLVFALAREVDFRGGVTFLESALENRQLRDEVKEYLSAYLQERKTMKKASWPFHWW